MGDKQDLMRTLMAFAQLRDCERTLFISQMNEFLLASPKIRRRLVEGWRGSADASQQHPMR